VAALPLTVGASFGRIWQRNGGALEALSFGEQAGEIPAAMLVPWSAFIG
jgi:hypothetical protein